MQFEYAVTYEYPTNPPETIRGEVVAGTISVAAGRAAKVARKAFPRRVPSSIVVLVMKGKKGTAHAPERAE